MAGRVAGKVAFITGAARGQGRAHAIRLAEEGADIIAIDICANVDGISYPLATPADLAQTAQMVTDKGVQVIAAQVDIRDFASLSSVLKDAVAKLGGLHVVAANAGVAVFGRWNTFTEQQWNAVQSVNVTGTWNTLRAALPYLISSGGGSVVVTSSTAGVVGMPYLLPYSVSKHALIGFVRSLANELCDQGVRLNAVAPTGVAGTGMDTFVDPAVLASNPKLAATFTNAIQVETIQPEDVSNAVVFLASDEARYITGTVLDVDAGLVNL
jgi:SDR family mycofactocin-dependent oxidoreductase